ncbi:MAG: hypothetical protein WDN03_00325 [Rhizomicrobium sp.]
MSADHHRGVRYSVTEPVRGRWKWEIHPPEAVKGLRPLSGEVDGSRHDAIEAAKRQIEIQNPQAAN